MFALQKERRGEERECRRQINHIMTEGFLNYRNVHLFPQRNMNFYDTRISGPCGPLEILAPAGGSPASPIWLDLKIKKKKKIQKFKENQ